ncbi:kynureninase [Nannochloropsis gaditana]|uniref:Kynureninase n=1 Tax=Nannochloropsis gaditana TaxID=72520 RepID=W7U210_9STRA|nr:kynureninase [Nannochloropsis gaditana]
MEVTRTYERDLAKLQQEVGIHNLADKSLANALDERNICFRSQFIIPLNGSAIYLCTNSLGLQPRRLRDDVGEVLNKWGQEGVTSWFRGRKPFANVDESVLDELASIIGAKDSHEVVAMNSLSLNIHLMLATFYRPTPIRRKIIVEENAFPSDIQVLRSHLALVYRQANEKEQARGKNKGDGEHEDEDDFLLIIRRRPGESTWRASDIITFLKDHGKDTALLFLSGLHFASGQCFDMSGITAAAHAQGILVGFDLAHAIGNVELHLHEWGVDFACWCHYKYMCAGPGAVGGVYVHEKHTKRTPPLPRLAGWWGQAKAARFTFNEAMFEPAPGALGFQLSTPSPLMLACLESALRLFKAAGGMPALRKKSVLLTGYLQLLLEQTLSDTVQIITPAASEERGCQLSLTFKVERLEAAQVLEALEARGVMGDVRHPNVIRVAPSPLYTRFVDVWRFVMILKDVLEEARDSPRETREKG